MMGSNGEIITAQNQLVNLLYSFYSQLFTSSNSHSIEDCLQGLSDCVTANMNNHLFACFTESEVIYALFQMNPLGAPGPDGLFPCSFFSETLALIKSDVCCYVLNFLNHNGSLKDVNSTYI